MHGQRSRQVIEGLLPRDGVMEALQVPDSSVEWVLLPHVFFEWMQTQAPRRFRQIFGARAEGVSDWWDRLVSNE